MKERLLHILNILAIAVATLILATIQTSLWFQIFGGFPPPALWVPGLIYSAITRSWLEATIVTYAVALVLSTMTLMPDGIMLISCLALVASARSFKQRIHWSGNSYVMLICGFSTLIFHVYQWIASMAFGEHTFAMPEISAWLIASLLTPLAAPALFRFFAWLDRVTLPESTAPVSPEMMAHG